MAKPTRRAPAAKGARKPPGPVNQSRGAGAVAPASAAATAPPAASFYDPGDETDSPLSMASEPLTRRTPIDAEVLRDEPDSGLSADVEVLVGVQETGDEGRPETYEEEVRRIRAMRKPLGEFSLKLDIEKRRGYHTHWFNDAGARIDEALGAGWAFRQRNGQRVRRAVGTGRDKGVLYAYAMDIPIEFWAEDLAARNQNATDKMASLKASPFRAPSGSAQKSDAGKFYSPVEGQEPIRQEHIDHF
jgi:hypothetical protein